MGLGRTSGAVLYGRGRLVTSQDDVLWVPPALTRKRPIFYLPPGNDVAVVGVDPIAEPGQNTLLSALCQAGALVVALDWDQHAWGNATVRGHIESVRTSIASVAASLGVPGASGIDASKIVLAAGSQGAVDCFGYTMDNPTRVQAIGTWAGVTDLIGFYTGTYRWGGDAGTSNQATIATAWGITYPTALPSNADPYNNASSITCPVLMGYSAGDATIPPAGAQAMAAALPNGRAVQFSATDPHSDGEAATVTPTLVPWLLAQAST